MQKLFCSSGKERIQTWQLKTTNEGSSRVIIHSSIEIMSMENPTISEEMEKIEIITDLFHACSLEQLREIYKCFIPKKGDYKSETLNTKYHG